MDGMPVENYASAEWESFLGRGPFALDQAKGAASITGKRILITGAGGWIGSALTRALAGFAPSRLVLLEAAERNLYEIDASVRELPQRIDHVSLLGNVLNAALLAEIFRRHRPQVIYHAAAFKHVPLMEQNPFSAIENNAIGTRLLVDAAVSHQAEQLILLSTDKAVDPVSIMGASKRIAELALLTPHAACVQMKAVRLGNVLGSEGSIVPLFLQQLKSGSPVTVTHPDVRRYFLTTEDAVALLVLASSEEIKPGIVAPDLGEPLPVVTLARHLLAQANGCNHSAVPIVFTQLRPGDKMCEALLSAQEAYVSEADFDRPLRAVKSPFLPAAVMDELFRQLQHACDERSVEQLLTAISRAVPEYRPSTVLQDALAMKEIP
jgi:FlaA1/EpsC-like NDP-sugar epimerase